VDRSDCDVRSICGGFARNYPRCQNFGGQLRDVRNVEQRRPLSCFQPLARSGRIAGACFFNDELRNVDVEGVPSRLPPVLSYLRGLR